MPSKISETRKCQHCGSDFAATDSRAQFCSGNCRKYAHVVRRRTREQMLKGLLDDVNIIFEPTDYGTMKITYNFGKEAYTAMEAWAAREHTNVADILQELNQQAILKRTAEARRANEKERQ